MCRDLLGDGLVTNPEVGVDDLSLFDEAVHDLLHRVGGDGKKETLDGISIFAERNPKGVHPDHFTGEIEERSPRVAGVDRGVVLNQVRVDA